jgi:AcrR family transcriptional regulator
MDQSASRHVGPFDLPAPTEAPWALARLPVGRHGLPREFIEENQRNRLMAAALEVFAGRGYAVGSIADVIKLAGVSRNTFYAHFDDKEACFLATYDALVDWLAAQAIQSAAGFEDWSHRVVAVIRSLTIAIADDPRLPRLLGIEALGAGARARARHQALIERLATAFQSGRDVAQRGPEPMPLLDQVLIAGAISVLVQRSEAVPFEEVSAELKKILLTPYLGPAASARFFRAAGPE